MNKLDIKNMIAEEVQNLKEADETLKKIGDLAKKKSLMSLGKDLKKMFGDKNVKVLAVICQCHQFTIK